MLSIAISVFNICFTVHFNHIFPVVSPVEVWIISYSVVVGILYVPARIVWVLNPDVRLRCMKKLCLHYYQVCQPSSMAILPHVEEYER